MKSIIPALLSSLALAAPLHNAMAASYAVSYDKVTNFGITPTGGTASFTAFTVSSDSAYLGGSGTASGNPADAAASCINCSYSNSFTSHGVGSPPGYSYGDAQILSTLPSILSNVLAGTGAASSIGEAGVFSDLAMASGSNTMSGTFTVSGLPTVLSFGFMANPYLLTSVTSSGADSALAKMGMQISIYQGSTKIFDWTPDGQAGGIFGGAEAADPFSLQTLLGNDASFTPGSGNFSASTLGLIAGTYKITIKMLNEVDVTDTTGAASVPVPAALPLLGSGLLGLFGWARRRTLSD